MMEVGVAWFRGSPDPGNELPPKERRMKGEGGDELKVERVRKHASKGVYVVASLNAN